MLARPTQAVPLAPYYERGGITIFHDDNLSVLPALTGQFDLVVTSPPWNLGGASNSSLSRTSRNRRNTGWGGNTLSGGYGTHADDLPWPEYVAWQQRVLLACWALLTDDGAIYLNHKPVIRDKEVRLPTELNPGLPLRQIVTIDRGSGFNFSRTHYLPVTEWLLVLAKPAFKLRDTAASKVTDLWRILPDLNTPHPAPFAPELPATAIGTTGARRILDPHAGWGTTLLAAKLAGAEAVGIEQEERFCEMAARRLDQDVLALW